MRLARTPHSTDSTLLTVRLKERIARNGPISVERYMDACLADANGGYYRSHKPIGARGDFITAPEVSQVFGELLGLWAYAVWQCMGAPEQVTVAELGPGRGTLMADALRAWRQFPGFLDSAKIVLVETSPTLRDVQQMTLADEDADIAWCDSIEALPQGPLIVLANEFIDALPVRQLVWRAPDWRERCVRIAAKGGFEFCDGPPVVAEGLKRNADAQGLPDGSILEIRPTANAVMAELGARAQRDPIAALIIDYGHEATACGDTLQAVSRHDFADPLQTPGDVDLTAHVDFAALKDATRQSGLVVYGPKPQGALLLDLGLEARRDRLLKGASEDQRQDIISATNRLVDPAAMGILFKALAATSIGLAPPPAFGDSEH